MKTQKFIKNLHSGYPLECNEKNICAARDFVMKKWIERSIERHTVAPEDLSHSCKFSSLFASYVFGATMQGNYDHQYCVLDNAIIDLNAGARDVRELAEPYRHDNAFWGNAEHQKSLKSCAVRVNSWLEEFSHTLRVKYKI